MAIFMLMDPEDCLGRITVGLTRSKSLTIVVSPLDMIGLIGMAQVLGTLAYGIKGLRRGTSTWDWPYFHNDPQHENASQVERWSLNQAQHGQCLPSPLPIATMTPTINWSKTPATGSSLPRPPTWTGSLATSMQCMTTAQLPKKARIIGYLRKTCLQRSDPIRICSRPRIQTNLRLSALRSLSCAQRQDLAAIRTQQEVTPLPGIYFFDGWRVRLRMKIPTDLPNPGTHPNVMFSAQRPQPLLLYHLKHQTRKDETYLPRLSGTKQRMDPAPDGQQFEPTSTCMPWSSSMDHNSKRYMRLPKNTPRVAKAMTNSSNTEPSHIELPTVPPQLTSELLHRLSTLPDPWPLAKITINLDTASFFFLAFGRCRAEARSLHEHKQSERHFCKDPVGPSKLANQN